MQNYHYKRCLTKCVTLVRDNYGMIKSTCIRKKDFPRIFVQQTGTVTRESSEVMVWCLDEYEERRKASVAKKLFPGISADNSLFRRNPTPFYSKKRFRPISDACKKSAKRKFFVRRKKTDRQEWSRKTLIFRMKQAASVESEWCILEKTLRWQWTPLSHRMSKDFVPRKALSWQKRVTRSDAVSCGNRDRKDGCHFGIFSNLDRNHATPQKLAKTVTLSRTIRW